jgi:polyisoprenoid-binding protein YceI
MKILKLSIILIFVFSFSYGQKINWQVDAEKSFIKYEGKHALHEWTGINSKIYGLAVSLKEVLTIKKIALLIYVRDFDSKNSGRDSRSLEVLEALQFPEIKFYSESIDIKNNIATFNDGSLEFHGIKINKTFSSSFEVNNNVISFNGELNLLTSDFGIELPSFMLFKMEDLLIVSYSIVLTK